MKGPKAVMVTARRQTKAVIGYVTGVDSHGAGVIGIMGASKDDVKRFITANCPHVEYSHSRTKRAAWVSMKGITTVKPRTATKP